MRNRQHGFSHIGVFLLLVVLAAVGFTGWYVYDKGKTKTTSSPASSASNTQEGKWQAAGVAIAGSWADAEVIDIGGGKWRMYYSVEPEVPGNKLELYSATSTDGAKWEQEPGVRGTFKTFPDIVQAADGSWRLYFQNSGVIKSATSTDGLNWQDEPGERVTTANELGLTLDNVAAGTTFRQAADNYVMVYRGTINQAYGTEKVPNFTTQLLLWAVSKDGLNFDRASIAIDSRNATLKGLTDGPELVQWSDGKLRLYFWSYKGVYFSTLSDGQFSEPQLAYTTATGNTEFPPDPPGDPTLAFVNDTWNMYYGQHQKGIYRAVLK